MAVHARLDGSFDLSAGGRVLLRGSAAPVTLLDYSPRVTLLWGQFDYDPGEIHRIPMSRLAGARVDGGDLLIDLAGDGGATAQLRFHEVPGQEVTVGVTTTSPGVVAHATELGFGCEAASRFLGFGEQYQAIDHRGEAFPLWVSEQGIGRDPKMKTPFSGDPWTSYFPVPFFLDPRGFGVAAETTARVAVDLCKSDPARWSMTLDETASTLHLFTGPTVAEVVKSFTGTLQGRGGKVPRWAVDGVWIGIQGGTDAVNGVVTKAKAANIPITAVWAQDWVGRLSLGGGLNEILYHWTADTTLYPDLRALTGGLKAQGVHFLGYFNPFLYTMFDEFKEGAARHFLVEKDDGTPYSVLIAVRNGGQLDVTNPEAVKWFQGFAQKAIDMGMDGWMCDFGEWLPYNAKINKGDPALVHNQYPSKWHAANRELLGDDRICFSRSGWLGEAKVAQVVWAGDQEANWSPWDGLPTVVPAMISLGLAGVAWVTHDIAGFSGGPSTRELYLRWTELGAFTPVMRTHEGLNSGNNWMWFTDDETLKSFARWSRVHAALADTFIQLGAEQQTTGMPIIRALALTWPDDAMAVGIADEYTIGEDLLVAPVTTQGAVARKVYFPKGHWTDVWDTAKSFDGPAEKMIDAPLGRPPVFSKSGRADLAKIQ